MKLIYKSNSILDKIKKVRIVDNMRDEIHQKIEQGVEFSNEATLALSVFPLSDAETVFSIVEDRIVKGAYKFKKENPKNWGYSFAEFHPSRYYNLEEYEGQELADKTAEQEEKKDWVCYYISYRELEKIGWTDAAIVPDFVTEVFTKLDCMPDEIVND
ncbi:hypothetical protein WAF17_02825 [Bernardetia sp. ABR2-2B]|uniref:hypothetical protein n=1 Tax=Bernardetia sp. ABR2-2B TaxID=3127472 RepID=UPI0030D3F069